MKKFQLFTLFIALPFLLSCNQLDSIKKEITSITNQVLELVGMDSKPSTKKKKKKKKEDPKIEEQATEQKNEAPVTNPPEAGDIKVPPPPEQQNLNLPSPTNFQAPLLFDQTAPPADTKNILPGENPLVADPGKTQLPTPDITTLTPPPPAPAAEKPVNPDDGLPLKRFMQMGGGAHVLNSDNRFIYVGFAQSLGFWDVQLNSRGIIPLEAKPIKVESLAKNQDTLLYIQEEGNILEIVKIPALGNFQFVKGFQVDGPFDGAFTQSGGAKPAQDNLYVFLPDRIQILDVTNPENIQVVSEPQISGAREVVVAGQYVYILRQKSLVVLDGANYSILATVPLESTYDLIGVKKAPDKNKIILAKLDEQNGRYTGYRIISAQPQGGSISDMGADITFPHVYSQIQLDETNQYFLAINEGTPVLYDLALNQEIVFKGAAVNSVKSLSIQESRLYALWEDGLKKYDWKMAEPLPGQTIPLVKELILSNEKKLEWAVAVGKFLIPSQYQLLFFSQSREGLKFFETANLKTGFPKPYILNGLTEVKKMRMGLLGVYFLDAKTNKIFLRKWDGSFGELALLSALKLDDLDVGLAGDTDVLMGITAKVKSKTESTLHIYSVDKAGVAKKKSSFVVPLSTSLKIWAQGKKVLLGCGLEGICLADLTTESSEGKGLARGGVVSVVKIKTQTPSSQLLASAVGISPDEKMAYAYYESDSGSFISVIDLKTNSESGIIPLMNVSRLQFEGMSFAQGGKKVLIPSDEGLLVLDVKDSKNPTLLFKWPIGKIEQVDVTNRGQSFCVNLGQKGLECANFQEPETAPAPAK